MEFTFICDSLGVSSILSALMLTADTVGEGLPEESEKNLIGNPDTLRKRVFEAIYKFGEQVFGSESWSVKSFKKSAKISFWTSLVLYLITYLCKNLDFTSLILGDVFLTFLLSYLSTLLLTIPFDMIAIGKTRYLFRYLTKRGKKKDLVKVILWDFLICFFIGFCKSLLIYSIFYGVSLKTLMNCGTYFVHTVLPLHYWNNNLPADYLEAIPGVYFYITFISSCFIWIYALSVFVFSSAWIKRNLKRIVDPESKPVKALKTVFVLLLVGIWAIVNISFVWIFPILKGLFQMILAQIRG